jgi:hypothetical protein
MDSPTPVSTLLEQACVMEPFVHPLIATIQTSIATYAIKPTVFFQTTVFVQVKTFLMAFLSTRLLNLCFSPLMMP